MWASFNVCTQWQNRVARQTLQRSHCVFEHRCVSTGAELNNPLRTRKRLGGWWQRGGCEVRRSRVFRQGIGGFGPSQMVAFRVYEIQKSGMYSSLWKAYDGL